MEFELNTIPSMDKHAISMKSTERNYAECLGDADIFTRNSESINIGIVVFKILDLILSKDINMKIYPLPKVKQALLVPTYISTLTQLLLIQNIDLAKEALSLIEKHFDS
jgi:hypothetical protein